MEDRIERLDSETSLSNNKLSYISIINEKEFDEGVYFTNLINPLCR